jgi:pimeloyl-ACP methyl ester carboxylesterase
MVHGSPGSSADNLSYLAHPDLLRVAQVYSVDRPGFGASEYGKAEPSLRQQAAALAPLVRSLRPRKVILTGHSYGGPVIAQFAVDYPELVDGLVIIAGSLDPELEPATWWKAPFDWPLVRNLLPPFLRTSNREILPLKKELQALQPDLQKITCPVLVFQGTKDDLVPAGNADYIRQQMRNSARMELRMLEGMDHFILWSELDRMVAGIIEWVQLSASATR